jgi:hypothetical protein
MSACVSLRGGFGVHSARNVMNTPMLRAERQDSEEKSK